MSSIRAAYRRTDGWRAKQKQYEGKHPLVVLYPEDKHRKSLWFTTLMQWLLVGVRLVIALLIHIFQAQRGGM